MFIQKTRLLLALVIGIVPLGIVSSNAIAQNQKVSHRVIIDSENQPGQTYYTLETPGTIQQMKGRVKGHSVSKNPKYDKVSNSQAQGRVSTGTDAFRVNGRISNLELTNPNAAKVYID